MTTTTNHRWKIYRSGGVDQVSVKSGADLMHLSELDPKLWLALSMPTRGVELDPRTLDLLDTDHDGFVRQAEVLGAVTWLRGIYKDLGHVLDGGDAVALDRLVDGPVLSGAKLLLANLGKPEARSVSLADATDADKMFRDTVFNGDGVIPPDSAPEDLRSVIDDIITAQGSLPDRSGKPGVDRGRIEAFFREAKTILGWHDLADAKVLPKGPITTRAAEATRAVRAKIDDYFTRCGLAAFDARAASALNVSDAELITLSPKQLSLDSAEVASLPLSRVEPGAALALNGGSNPAWRARLATFVSDAVVPLIGPLIGPGQVLTEQDWHRLLEQIAAHETWFAARPATKLDAVPVERLRAVVPREAEILALLDRDLAVKEDVESIASVERLCRYQRDLKTLLDNYVNFSMFYSGRGGVFQAGTLYLDGRGCNLVLEVTDLAKHNSMAPMAGAYLAYCECTRAGGEKKMIAAAFTAGDVDNLFVGRNGVFVDRKGVDWQATITKVIDNPLSIRQAFWAPYKKLVRAIEERVAKRAAAADAEADAKLGAVAHDTAEVGKAQVAATAAADAAAPKKGIDVGTVAALGVAVGGIAAVLTAVLAGVFGLGKWAPIALIAIMIAISLPSMVLAFIKLRRRNLGPLLDANGWAINALTKINVPFGTSLTDRATIPKGAERSMKDPYAEKRPPWGLYLTVVVIAGLAAAWYYGKLDDYLPDRVKSTVVFKRGPAPAPAAEAPKP